MGKPLHILIVEDSEDDAALLLRQLRRDGYEPLHARVDETSGLLNNLQQREWDIIISDYVLPQFSGLDVLKILQERNLDIPCIIVSGKITDETAVAAMRTGAKDYVMKDNLKRLGPIIQRELDEAKMRWERNAAEQELALSRTNFRNVILNDADGVLIVDIYRIIRFSNPAAEALFGRSAGQLVNTQFEIPIINRHNPELEISRPNGTKIIVDMRVAETEWEGERAFLATLRDITDRISIERALRESNEFSNLLMRNAPNPMVAINPDGSIRYANPALEALTGYSNVEIIGSKPPFPWWSGPKTRQRLARFMKDIGIQFSNREMQFVNKNGDSLWVETASTPIRSESGELLFVLYSWIDITERKRLNEEMEYYVRKVTEAQEEERGRIARELHDDTAQSLSVISLEMDALLNRNQNLSAEVADKLRWLKENTNRSLDEVRRFSHELRPSLLDNLGLLPAIEQLIDEGSSGGDLEIRFDVNGDENRLSKDIELALFRIVQESLNNIRKHARASLAEVCLDFDSDSVRLTVIDNGKGFDKQIEKQAIAGGHMGLIGMRERARLIGADLKVQSTPGKGTIVAVKIDIVNNPDTVASAE